MGLLPRVSIVTGAHRSVPAAPLVNHLAPLANSDHTALIYSDETSNNRISYAELAARTNALARAMVARARGANQDGDYVVAVCMQPTHNTVMTLLSTWKLGGSYVPMEPSFPQTRISHILKDIQPCLIVYDDTANPSMFAQSRVPYVSFEELALEAGGLPADNLRVSEQLAKSTVDSIAIVLYTSGSAGIPKGVRLSYTALCNRIWWQFRTFPFLETEGTCVWKTSLTFGDSVCELWAPLLQGRSLLILSKETTRDPQKLVKVLAENQVQRLVLVPTLLRSILMYLSLNPSDRPLKYLKLWICSGETLSKVLARQFFQYFGDCEEFKLANFYGSTEVMGDVTYYVLEKSGQLDLHPTIPIGKPLDNCAVYLLDEEMNPTRETDVGEIWVSGVNLASGYVGGQAPDKFCDNPHADHPDFRRLYRTGDFGVYEKGVILYAGRTDTQVKIRGHRVDLMEVERAVIGLQGVKNCIVLCYGLQNGNPDILAFVTTQPEARLSAEHIEKSLKSCLTDYMLPQVIVIDSVPLLVSGKVDQQALLKSYENTNNDATEISLNIDHTGVDPQDMDAARVLFATVGAVLGRAARGAVSLAADFYELGGNSLNSIYTITKLQEQGYYIEISDFLGASNLGEILTHLRTTPICNGEHKEKFTAGPMRDEHKDDVISMTACSFCEKVKLEQVVLSDITRCTYAHRIMQCWPALLQQRLSVVLTDESGKLVAVALNFDARDEPEVEVRGGLATTMAFLEFVEASVRDSLPPGKGTVLHSFLMSTAPELDARDNVAAIMELELATVRAARRRGYKGVFATNTSPLTQQLGRDVLGFQTLLDYQVNQYADGAGARPFAAAPDHYRALVAWKPLD